MLVRQVTGGQAPQVVDGAVTVTDRCLGCFQLAGQALDLFEIFAGAALQGLYGGGALLELALQRRLALAEALDQLVALGDLAAQFLGLDAGLDKLPAALMQLQLELLDLHFVAADHHGVLGAKAGPVGAQFLGCGRKLLLDAATPHALAMMPDDAQQKEGYEAC